MPISVETLTTAGPRAPSVSGVAQLNGEAAFGLTESEYTTASKAGCEILWTQYLFEELGYNTLHPSPLLVDNRSAIQVVKHPEH